MQEVLQRTEKGDNVDVVMEELEGTCEPDKKVVEQAQRAVAEDWSKQGWWENNDAISQNDQGATSSGSCN